MYVWPTNAIRAVDLIANVIACMLMGAMPAKRAYRCHVYTTDAADDPD